MTQDEIIRSPIGREQLVALAREAGFARYMTDGEINWKMFERFAALVAAHEREAFKVYVNQVVADREMAVHDAVLAEREACAKLLLDDALALTFQTFGQYRTALAAAIRSRCSHKNKE